MAESAIVVLSDRTITAQLAAGRIEIDPYDPALLQPSSVDVRVDRYFRVFRNNLYPYIDVKAEQPDLTELVEIGDEPFVLHPGEFVLGSTLERVKLPDDLVARLEGKRSLGRPGLLLHSGQLTTILDGSPDARADASDTDASWVSARELLARLPLDGTRHVQLLACSTHADDPAPGDELAGLISAFLVRGAASVAGTLWPVNELPACLVGWWIASATASGASPASAFHDAITRLRHATPSTITATLLELRPASATDPHARDAVDRSLASLASLHPHAQPFSHPAHWAPYVLHGSPS